jgi:hypothetical protein
MKNKILVLLLVIILVAGIIFFVNNDKNIQSQDQTMLEQTYNISKEYVSLRYSTDNVLINAKDYSDYESWNKEMWTIILWWEKLEKEALALENIALEVSQEDVGFNIITKSQAYNKQEISDVFDKAPAWKKIKTLAKFLWVDAKKAFKILQQDQAQVEADAWNEAGDTFQKLETSATLIKDGCKVAWFVGWIIVTGWTSALAAWSTLAKATVIISWADLTLEVTDDAAKIALWNHNKISAIIWDGRKITEPLSTILNISSIPWNLASKYEKFSAVMTWLDQFNSAAQDGKIVWIELPVYTKDKTKPTIKTVVLEKEEVQEWLKEIKKDENNDTISKEEIEDILWNLSEEIKAEKETEKNEEINDIQEKIIINNNDSIVGTWKWTLQNTAWWSEKVFKYEWVLNLNKDWTMSLSDTNFEFFTWTIEWDIVNLYWEDPSAGYYQFNLSGNNLTLIKVYMWGTEYYAGKEGFMWGKTIEWTLIKQ